MVGLEGIDTRALTRHIRNRGAMEGGISSLDLDPESLLDKVERAPGLVGVDLVREVTISESYVWEESLRGRGVPRWSRTTSASSATSSGC